MGPDQVELEDRVLAALLTDDAGDHEVTDLAEACGVGYRTMKRMVARLEARDLVIDLRQPGPPVVRLTVKGIGRAVA